MDVSTDVRRSSRRKIRPVEFWNFENPDEVELEDISYNVSHLCKFSVSDIRNTDLRANKSHRASKSTIVNRSKTPRTEKKRKDKTKTHNQDSALKVGKHRGKADGDGAIKRKKGVGQPPKENDVSQSSNIEGKGENDLSNVSNADKALSKSFSKRDMSQSQTSMELPSFHNVFSSTVIGSHSTSTLVPSSTPQALSGTRINSEISGVFKVPTMPPPRRQKRTFVAEPSMEVIAEESCSEISMSEETNQKSHTSQISTTQVNQTGRTILGYITNTTIQQKGSVTNRTLSSVNKANVSGYQDRHKENSLHQSGINLTGNNTSTLRRSGRIRTKPLEFWNFEKADVTHLDNGEVNITYHKQNIPGRHKSRQSSPTHGRPAQTSATQQKNGKTATSTSLVSKGALPSSDSSHTQDHPCGLSHDAVPMSTSLESSPGKRKLCTPGHSLLDSTLADEDGAKHRKLMEERGLVTPQAKIVHFEDLQFHPFEARNCKYYIAICMRNAATDVYAGFIFLEHGHIVWTTSKETNLLVVDGAGKMETTEGGEKGVSYLMKAGVNVSIPSGRKICLQKDGRCRMLRLYAVIGEIETERRVDCTLEN